MSGAEPFQDGNEVPDEKTVLIQDKPKTYVTPSNAAILLAVVGTVLCVPTLCQLDMQTWQQIVHVCAWVTLITVGTWSMWVFLDRHSVRDNHGTLHYHGPVWFEQNILSFFEYDTFYFPRRFFHL